MSRIIDPMSRRRFLASMAALSLSGASVLSDSGSTHAQSTDDDEYKALVCVFFAGGMDHNDMILPYGEVEYSQMSTVRQGIFEGYSSKQYNRDRLSLIPLTSINDDATQGRTFAVPEELRSLQQMFDAEELCLVGGIGTLIEPVTRSQFESQLVALPPALFSHNDQQNYFQGLAIEGAQAGWGGRFIDVLTADGNVGNNPQYASISTGGNNLFLAGKDTPIFQVGAGTVLGPEVERLSAVLGEEAHMDLVRAKLVDYFRNSAIGGGRALNLDMQNSQTNAINAIDGFGDSYNDLPS